MPWHVGRGRLDPTGSSLFDSEGATNLFQTANTVLINCGDLFQVIILFRSDGTRGGTRTHTTLLSTVFETVASTNSATRAGYHLRAPLQVATGLPYSARVLMRKIGARANLKRTNVRH